jgi:nicotinamidase-related amidase
MPWPLPETVTMTITMPKPKEFVLDPAKTLLMVVDVQNSTCTPGFPNYGDGRYGSVIEGNVKLLEKARAAGAKVMYIQSVRKEQDPEVIRFGIDPHLLEGSAEAAIVDAIAPLPSEEVIYKWCHDPWARTSLEDVLARHGIVSTEYTVLVTGVSASVCAHAAALGFANRHFLTLIPMDATAAGDVEQEARVYAQYAGVGYDYCMDFTLSDLVTFESPVKVAVPARELVGATA